MTTSPLDDETALREWFGGAPSNVPNVQDPLHRRLVDAVSCNRRACRRRHEHARDLDVAVLCRHVLRRCAAAECRFEISEWWHEYFSALEACGVQVVQTESGRRLAVSLPWRPSELGCDKHMPDVDASSLAGLPSARRAPFLVADSTRAADDFFKRATGHDRYRTPGQQTAARSALVTPAGSTLVSLLPTGSGKTEVALAAIRSAFDERRTSVIVVPTVALALDLEERIRRTFETVWEMGDEVWEWPFAWTGLTAPQGRRDIVGQVIAGLQPVVITSPESLLWSPLGPALIEAAGLGRVGWFVVDEAHMIDQWGGDFRPEFDQLGQFARQLVEAARSHDREPCRVMLLSATLTADNLANIRDDFGTFGPVQLVAANSLRRELDVWMTRPKSVDDRLAVLKECLLHLPRPAIIYTTLPDDADDLCSVIRRWGFSRVNVFTGRSAGADRREVFAGFRGVDHQTGAPAPTEYDIVIGTSAFGLGVDYDQVRTVIHLCVPETIERWYQEVGRAGRDGNAATAVFMPIGKDVEQALSMGAKRLEVETAQQRWQTLHASLARDALALGGGDVQWMPLNLQATNEQSVTGSYNIKWNRQVIRGLEDCGLVATRSMLIDEIVHANLPTEVGGARSSWIAVRILDAIPSDFTELWTSWREQQIESETDRRQRVLRLADPTRHLCAELRNVFMPDSTTIDQYGAMALNLEPAAPCGRCPGCRAKSLATTPELPRARIIDWVGSPPRRAQRSKPPKGIHYVQVDEAEELDAVARLGKSGYLLLLGAMAQGDVRDFLMHSHDLRDALLCPRVSTVAVTKGSGVPPELGDLLLSTPKEPTVVLVRARNELTPSQTPVVSWTEFCYERLQP